MNDVLAKNPELCNGFLELMHYHAIELFGGWTATDDVELNLDKVLEHKVSLLVQLVGVNGNL